MIEQPRSKQSDRPRCKSSIGSEIPLLLAILSLLICPLVAPADQLTVVKDSEAGLYAGKYVEVRGLVVSVTTSPLGTIFINFGGEYPNQTFAGFVAAGSKMEFDQRIAALPGKVVAIVGTIQLNKGKPEIAVTSKEQIRGLNSQDQE